MKNIRTADQARDRVRKIENCRHRLETGEGIKGRDQKIAIVNEALSQARAALKRLEQEEYEREVTRSYDLDGV